MCLLGLNRFHLRARCIVSAGSAAALVAAILSSTPAGAQPEPAEDPAQAEPAPQDPADPGAEPKPAEPPARPELVPPALPPTPQRSADLGTNGPAAAYELTVRYTLEAIEIKGNTRTGSRVVLRYVPFQPGDIIDVDDPAVELARYRLLSTGFFRDVQFSLRKGSRRGHVVLVIEVAERNTIVVNDLWMGLAADVDRQGKDRPLIAYAGVDAAETNLAGSGITLGSALGYANDQLALRVRFLDPAFLGSPWMTSGMLLFNDARDFFGNARVLVSPGEVPDKAVVSYKRFGGVLGVGHDLSISSQLWLRYRLESIDARVPATASHVRGLEREPIDFDIIRGQSLLSTLQATLQLDTRDQPFLPTRGWFASFGAELSLLPTGSDYDYQKLEVSAARWFPLPWKSHVLKLEAFAGAIGGEAPFFEQYYVGDFTDLLPARVLGLNFDRRPPPNFLNTAIVEVRYGEFAGKLGAEYRIPLYRGSRSVYGIDLFGGAGVYGVAGRREFTDPPSGYSGATRIPVDLTFNLGFRMDTSVGGFVFSLSNVLGFVPVRGEGPAGDR